MKDNAGGQFKVLYNEELCDLYRAVPLANEG
jgi:hypothetical protein